MAVSISDVLAIFSSMRDWLRLKAVPDRLDALERRIAAMEGQRSGAARQDGGAEDRAMRVVILAVMAVAATGGAAAAQERPTATTERAWAGYLAVTIPACGLRDAAWGEAMRRGVYTEVFREPTRWGIAIRSTLGVRYPDVLGVNQAEGAISMATHIGALLHARMPGATCAEARRVATMSDATVRQADARNVVSPLPADAAGAGTLIFVTSLAAGPCRLRRQQWFDDAFPQILARMPPGPPSATTPTDREARAAVLGQMNGAAAFADQSPAIAHRVFGAGLCQSLRTWPELREADAAAAEGARLRTRPGGIWRDVVPID